jgi:quinoprotein glucose dehydrogenase
VDRYLRAFDSHSGRELWKARLPAGGQATPMTYVWGGRQYVLIAAGGSTRLGSKLGDAILAFRLPE